MREIGWTTRYIRFVKVAQKPKTQVWEVEGNSSGELLGAIQWYAPWRQYCFEPTAFTVFNSDCLKDIQTFIMLRNAEQRGQEGRDAQGR